MEYTISLIPIVQGPYSCSGFRTSTVVYTSAPRYLYMVRFQALVCVCENPQGPHGPFWQDPTPRRSQETLLGPKPLNPKIGPKTQPYVSTLKLLSPTLNYQNLLFCRVPINSILGLKNENLQKVGFGSLRYSCF